MDEKKERAENSQNQDQNEKSDSKIPKPESSVVDSSGSGSGKCGDKEPVVFDAPKGFRCDACMIDFKGEAEYLVHMRFLHPDR